MERSAGSYLSDVGSHPLLDDSETNELIRKAQGGNIPARNRIILHNMRWVIKISNKYCGRGMDQEELISEGVLGLIHAIDKCDPKIAKFSTYSTFWIESYMDRATMDKGRLVRIPIHRTKYFRKIAKFQKQYREKCSCDPSLELLADHLGKPTDFVAHIIEEQQHILSLEYEYGDDEISKPFGDSISKTSPDHSEAIEEESTLSIIYRYIDALSERERMVLTLRYGLYEKDPHTFEATSKIMGISRERIRQIQVRAQEKIKRKMTADPRHGLITAEEPTH